MKRLYRSGPLPIVGSTLENAFDPKCNNLNALRLLFAAMVLVGHSYHVGFGKTPPHVGSIYIHDVAVDGFFVVSGFLISNSRLRSPSTALYLKSRFFRIFPGYWASLLFCALVIAPVVLVRQGESALSAFRPSGALRFVVANSFLIEFQHGVGNALAGAHVPFTLDGSYWTLFYEWGAYCLVAVLALRSHLGRKTVLVPILIGVAWLTLLWVTVSPDTALRITHSPEIVPRGARLGLLFLIGVALRIWASRLVYSGRIAAACLVLFLVSSTFSEWRLVGAIPFAYLVLWVGFGARLRRVGSKHDISYGIYLYAWPCQQLLWALNVPRFGLLPYIVSAGALTTVLAFVSFYAVEQPFMRLGRRLPVRSHRVGRVDLHLAAGDAAMQPILLSSLTERE